MSLKVIEVKAMFLRLKWVRVIQKDTEQLCEIIVNIDMNADRLE